MKRGEVYWVDFSASVGGEIRKVRPAVIVSNDDANRFLNRVQVVPFTNNTNEVYPSEAIVTLGGKKEKAMADQLATVSKLRLSRRAGALSEADMQKVAGIIKVQLGLV